MGRLEKRLLSGIGLLLVLGCRGSTPMVDPFGAYGPTRIPPPATGTAGRPDPYYRRSQATSPSADVSPRLSALPAVPQSQFRSQPAPNDGAFYDGGPRESNAAGSDNLDWRSPVRNDYANYDTPPDSSGFRPRPRFSSPADPLSPEPMELDSRSLETARRLQ